MQAHSSSSPNFAQLRLRFQSPLLFQFHARNSRFRSHFNIKLPVSRIRDYAYSSKWHRLVRVTAMDWDSMDSDGTVGYAFSSSEGEESDGDVMLNPITEIDIPTSSEQFHQPDDALTVTARELRKLGRAQRRSRIKDGMLMNVGLVTFMTVLLLLLDLYAWRIVRLPLSPFHLMGPFSASAVLAASAGYICVPLFRRFKMQTIIRKWPARHSSKKGTATMGGLFLIPIGVVVAEVLVGFSSVEVSGAAIATIAFATIGLVDDFLSLVKSRNNGLSRWIRILLEVAVGIWFSFWLCTRNISSPYSMYTFL